jgi:hypothetical protein
VSPPPLLGFNNNVRHRGRIFHIQTEDSGVKFPRIVTHLFADGGRIVKTTRTDYSQHLEKPDMATVVRGMMKEQHKGMFAALRAGDLDDLLEQVCGPLEAPKSKAADSVKDLTARHDLETAQVLVGSEAKLVAKPATAVLSKPPEVAPPEPAAAADARAVGDVQSLREAEAPGTKRAISNPNLRKPTPSVAPPPADAFDLDVASLDKIPPKPARPAPTPATSLAGAAATTTAPARPVRKSNPAAPRKSRPPIPARPAAAPSPSAADVGPGSLGRPQTRLAAVPQTNARSIFGDGAISEQSLDEVILSYLAEDLEETK